MRIGANRCPKRGRPVSLVPVASGQAFPSTVVPRTRDDGMPDSVRDRAVGLPRPQPTQNIEIPLIKWPSELFGAIGQSPIYEGAGSRIRTDDLLITNQLLYQLSYAGKNAPESSADLGPEQEVLDDSEDVAFCFASG